MKKIVTLLLCLCLTLSMLCYGCGGSTSDNSSQNTEDNDSGKTDSSKKDETKEDKKNETKEDKKDTDSKNDNTSETLENEEIEENSSSSYVVPKYEDFSMTWDYYDSITGTLVYFDQPPYGMSSGGTGYFGTCDNNAFQLITCKQDFDTPSYDGPIEGLFEECMPEFMYVLGDSLGEYFRDDKLFDTFEYTTTVVTLDSGIEAVKFEGTRKSWADYKYYIYGYCLVYDAFDLTIGYVIEDKKDYVATYETMLKDIVDRMVTTVRSEE